MVVLDQDSVHEWVEIDKAFRELYAAGKMGPAHYSDVVRFLLLEKYGGYWIDSTVYLAAPPAGASHDRFWSVKRPPEDPSRWVSRQRWVSYAFGGPPQHPLWSFMIEFYRAYWRRYDTVADYLIIDYALDYAYENVDVFQAEVDALRYNSLGVRELAQRLNDPATGDWRRQAWARDSEVFKLSHKEAVLRSWLGGRVPQDEVDGVKTIYGDIRSVP